MSSFTTPLIVSPMPNGHDWKLIKKFTYHIGSKFSRKWINVPAGFITDFASIPAIFWFLPAWAKYNKAPIIHDWLYYGQYYPREEADWIFYEAMLVDLRNHKSGKLIAMIEYIAVRIFGRYAWSDKKKRAGKPALVEAPQIKS